MCHWPVLYIQGLKLNNQKHTVVFNNRFDFIVILQMQTSHPRILLRWPLPATPVALSRPSRTCVVRTSTDEIWKIQQSEGHVLSSAARGPPLVFRRREHAESATKSAPWYYISCWQIKLRTANLLLCCFIALLLWYYGERDYILIDQFHYNKIFTLGLWLGEIKQK